MRIVANICRILTGLVFVLSGFVKGVDPLGTAYRLEDYFQVFHMTWLLPAALFFSILLCTFEFTLGVALIFSIRLKLTAWVLLFVSSFFTVLTFFDALNNSVPDCGCFGDALKLTNWQTFYKNIVLMVLTVIIFSRRKRTVPCFLPKNEIRFTSIILVLFAAFSVYSYAMLPVIDFLPFKQGARLISKVAPEPKIYLTYKNIKTGETKEYLSPNFPWNDKVWMSQWVFQSKRVITTSDNDMINVQDYQGADVTREVLSNP
ncbi:MAG: DoxX family protein, partial [Bacteroidota bacterium]|nr:DoxX family protein [Bacteroidota bacterium]